MLGRPSPSWTLETAKGPASRGESRAFIDCVGTSWTVTEVQPLLDLSTTWLLQPHPERRGGWLLFESDEGERRRLAPFPSDWRTISDFELERWCMRALERPDELRRRDD